MKKNNKGFMLIETLIVSISISGILIYLFFQFQNVNDSYNKSFKYNTINGLYGAGDIKENIKANGLTSIYNNANSSSFVDITNCSSTYFNNTNYCLKLNELLGVKTILVSKGNLSSTKTLLANSQNITKYSETLRDFINKTADISSGYQLFVEYNDNTVASVVIGG